MRKKEKKEKITYIDDGRTIADMSATRGATRGTSRDARPSVGDGASTSREKQPLPRSSRPPRSTFREHWATYCAAVKMMFLPMLAVLGIIALAFLIVYILL